MQLSALEYRHMGDLAYGAIRDAILAGQLLPGSRLGQDELARQLGVSRAPVRDALNRLISEGLVSPTPKGVVVAEMTARELQEVFEVRALIDGYATGKACGHVTQDEIDRLQENLDETARLTESGDIHSLVKAHADFHRILYDNCGNSELARIARSIWDRSYRYRITGLLNKDTARTSLDEHRAILAAIRSGNADHAQELMARHTRQARDGILRFVGAAPLAGAVTAESGPTPPSIS